MCFIKIYQECSLPKFQKAKYKADFGAFNTTNCMKLKVDLKYFICMHEN